MLSPTVRTAFTLTAKPSLRLLDAVERTMDILARPGPMDDAMNP